MKKAITLISAATLAVATGAMAQTTTTDTKLTGKDRAAEVHARNAARQAAHVRNPNAATPAIPATPADPSTGMKAVPATPAVPAHKATVGATGGTTASGTAGGTSLGASGSVNGRASGGRSR